MQALVFLNNRLELRLHHPDPAPGEGEALIRVRLAGICATDLQIIKGYMGFSGILGHEFVGTVAEGSPRWKGRRVVAQINCPCGKCDMCLRGLSTHCRRRTVMGIAGRDGCFAQRLTVPEANLHEVPPSVTDEEAVFAEPLAAAYQVLSQCPMDAKTSVAVVGAGRLGILVAQVLKSAGCRPLAIGRQPAKLERCEKLGIQAVSADEARVCNDRDVVVDCSGSPEGFRLAMGLVRPRGTIVLKSTYADNAGLVPNLAPLVIHEVRVLGSRCGSFSDALNALARKSVEVTSLISRTFPLSQGLEAFEFCRRSDVLKVLLAMEP